MVPYDLAGPSHSSDAASSSQSSPQIQHGDSTAMIVAPQQPQASPASAESSQAGPSSLIPPQYMQGVLSAPISGWKNLLEACFDPDSLRENGPPQNSEFVISAQDGANRFVILTFMVYSRVAPDSKGYRCKLEWDENIVPCGNVISVTNGHPTPKTVTESQHGPLGFSPGLLMVLTGLSIDIYSGEKAVWELTSNHPNNMFSQDFLRSFLAEGINEHSMFLQGQNVYLRLSDHSPSREMYWLKQGNGKTYYEGVWGMQYECVLLRFNSQQRKQFRKLSKDAMKEKASTLLRNREYNPIKQVKNWENSIRHYSEIFKFEMDLWFTPDKDFGSMTIRDALKEFVNGWQGKRNSQNTGPKYGPIEQITLAQDTFVFFFRYHPLFEHLAKQVLSGYDDACIFMIGVPKRDLRYNFVYAFRPVPLLAPREME